MISNKRILITGVSSGIGRKLAIKLMAKNWVWGVARREVLLKEIESSQIKLKFNYTKADFSQSGAWQKIISAMKKAEFIPEVVIFNAGIYKDAKNEGFDIEIVREVFEVNFFSIIKGIELLQDSYNSRIHFLAISSTSALKGSKSEGIAYGASKAALSIAFESLYQKQLKSNFKFSTIFFGPINTDMNPHKKSRFMVLSEEEAVNKVIKAIKEQGPVYYSPDSLFRLLFLLRLIPANLTLKILNFLENLHQWI
ncbi:SDR family NAD(P)-dependent oxidoreductase [Candidatus Daviesbacteria bacterium]|nr:SDR family NAD(P)-dependent oxidoreductase [Candidatus Daviesbacteria bacterium]